MDILFEWLGYAARWGHVLAAITWIGTSFYFNWLDLSERPPQKKTLKPSVVGEVHEMHGGSFYYHERYWPTEDNPRTLAHSGPAQLTFLTGFFLVVYIYWMGPSAYLLDHASGYTPLQAIVASAIILFAPYFLYNAVCILTDDDTRVFFFVALMTMLVSYYASTIFSARAAFIHVGAMLGTIMAANVQYVIIPNHIKMRAQVKRGEPVNQEFHTLAKRRSQHNNYMTLPVVFSMVSVHLPLATSGRYSWLILVFIMASGFFVRHYRNIGLREGRWRSVYAMLAVVFLVIGIGLSSVPAAIQVQDMSAFNNESEKQAFLIVRERCAGCHSAVPTIDGFVSAPGGIVFETVAQIKLQKDLIFKTVIESDVMPPGNMTHMVDTERVQLGTWLAEIGAVSPGDDG